MECDYFETSTVFIPFDNSQLFFGSYTFDRSEPFFFFCLNKKKSTN